MVEASVDPIVFWPVIDSLSPETFLFLSVVAMGSISDLMFEEVVSFFCDV